MKTKKHFGQHFLKDQQILAEIVASIHPQKADHLLEVGPGPGALTRFLMDKVQRLDVVEIDRDLIPRLQQFAQSHSALQVHQADILKFDLSTLSSDGRSLRVVGNFPYNISTPLLFHLMDYKDRIVDIHAMLQKEVVDRIVAEPDTDHYGRLSVMLQYHCAAQILFDVPPEAFDPPPKVDSAVVRLVPFEKLPYLARDYTRFAEIVKAAFMQRRKMIRNTLKAFVNEAQLIQLGLAPTARAETLSVQDFVRMANVNT